MDPEEYPGYILAPRYTAKEIAERRRKRTQNQAMNDPQDHEQHEAAAGIAAVADPAEPADPDPENRLTQFVWCQCGHCMYIPHNPTLKMCICCQEQNFDGLNSKLDSPDHIIPCITQHQDFDAMCRTNAVLEMMEAFTREKRGYSINQDWSNRLYRLLAYQSYTYWIHQRLGKNNRRVIPACVINAIRENWPEDDNTSYVSYKDANEDELYDAFALG